MTMVPLAPSWEAKAMAGRGRSRWISVGALAGVLGVTHGCSSAGETTEAVSQARLAAQATPGALTWSLPSYADPLVVPLIAMDELTLNDRAQVLVTPLIHAPVANTGNRATTLGVSAKTAAVTSVGGVFLRNQARVAGDVRTAGGLTEQQGAVVTGVRHAGVPVAGGGVGLTLSFGVVGPSIESFTTPAPPPGRYGVVTVRGGSLTLRSGVYQLDELIVDPGMDVIVDATGGPVIVLVTNAFRMQGKASALGGGFPGWLVAYTGTADLYVGSSLDGTVLAPNAKVNFSVGSKHHTGGVVAKRIELHQDSTFTRRPFPEGWVRIRKLFGLEPLDRGDCRFSVPVVAAGRNGYSTSHTARLVPFVGLNPIDEVIKDEWDSDIGVTAAAFGDFNGDGLEELALGRSGNPDARVVVRGNVHQNFGDLGINLLSSWGEDFRVRAIATGDIDNDGLDEIAVARGGGGIEITLIDDALAGHRVIDEWNIGDRNANSMAFGDTDGDGRLELVVARDSRNGGDRIWMLQDASEGYAVSSFGDWGNTDRNATAVAVGDLDADGVDEIAVGRSPGEHGRVLIYRYDAASSDYQKVGDFADHWDSDRGVTALAFGDVDGNGDSELVVGRDECSGFGCDAGDRGFVFDLPFTGDELQEVRAFGASWDDDRRVIALATGDLDDDGRNEILVSRSEGDGGRVLVLDDALENFSTIVEHGGGWGTDREAPALAVSRQDVCQSRPAEPIPASAAEAKAGFEQRRADVIHYWLKDVVAKLEAGPGGDTPSEFAKRVLGGSKHDGLHRIIAATASIKDRLADSGILIGRDFAGLANRYIVENVNANQPRVGTGIDEEDPGDFDFQLMEHLVLAYGFADLKLNTGAYFLSDAALEELTVGTLLYGLFTNEVHNLEFTGELGFTVPETENHVLMINTWSYLMNQAIRNGFDGGQRMLRPVPGDPGIHVNEGSALERFLLAAVGRFVQNGSWETNARPYQAYTLRALQLLATHAESSKLRVGARNALDVLAAKFAFQSLNGKRLPPIRRNWNHRHHLGVYQNDYVPAQLGVLTGALVFDDHPDCPDGRLCGNRGGQPRGFALDSAVLGYRVPDAIVDFMLRPDNHRDGYGLWARMQDRYTERHYLRDKAPRYPMPSPLGQPNLNQEVADGTLEIEAQAEFYFVTRGYMNSAGGHANRYEPFASQAAGGSARDATDFVSRPTVLIGNLDLGYWTEFTGTEQETLAFRGGSAFPMFLDYNEAYSANTGVYKNLAYGYRYDNRPAVRIPDHWRVAASAPLGNATFSVLDVTTTGSVFELPDHYVVVGDLPPQPSASGIAWGLWEVVPRRLFANEQALLAHVLTVNDSNDLTSGASTEYTLAVSGEKITFQDSYPPLDPFAAIDDDPSKVADVHLRWPARAMPMMDVRQVNENYQFTGVRYACASGDGRLVVNNPHLGTRLVLDSSNHQDPTRLELTSLAGTSDPCGSVTLPSCSDGLQNGTETGLDCGGGCSPCVAPLVTTLVPDDDWGAGVCTHFSVTNNGAVTATSFAITLDLTGFALTQSWNGTFSGATGHVTVTPAAWNRSVPPGTTDPQIGFCASRADPSVATLPVVTGTTATF
jgi:hypothetical protein